MKDPNDLKVSPDEVELPDAPDQRMQIVRYALPGEVASKVLVPLARSDIMYSAVQIIREGGANNLHSHTGMDGLWFVLRGRMRFYGEGNKLIGEFGQFEGVFVPRNVPYWFESIGEEPLEVLQAESIDRRGKNRRIDFEDKKKSAEEFKIVRQNA